MRYATMCPGLCGGLRRVLSAAVAAAGVWGVWIAPAAADVVVSSDFECPGFLPGPLNGQQGWSSPSAVLQGVAGPLGGAQSVQLSPSGALLNADRALNIPVDGQVVTISVDWFVQDGNLVGGAFRIFGDTGLVAQLGHGGTVYYVGNAFSATPTLVFPGGVWRRLVLRLDFVAGAITGTVDGISLGAALPFNTVIAPTRLTLFTALVNSSVPTTFRIDNITVTTSRPVNDLCAGALPITTGSTVTSNVNAGADTPGVTCTTIGPDIWYAYTAAAAGLVTASTCGAGYDTVLAAYSGNCGALAQVGCNDDTAGCTGGCNSILGSRMTFTAAAGQTYLIRLGGFTGLTGAATLNVSLDTTGACCNKRSGQCVVADGADCAGLGLNFLGLGAACSPAACTACPADFNNNNALGVQDIFDFLAAYFGGCP